MRNASVTSVMVVVPVRNEQDLLPGLIDSVRTALERLGAQRPDIRSSVIFGLDGCSDRSETIVRDSGFHGIALPGVGVGAARRAAVRSALHRVPPNDWSAIWLANTDADSRVPANWLTRQMKLADMGADVVVGSVEPFLSELDPERRRAWEATHYDGRANGHVHGANLGIRASTYFDAGEFPAVFEHEDVDLVSAAARRGASIVSDDDHRVVTSARLLGRTAGGYAGYLRDQLIPLAGDTTMARPSLVAGQ